MNTNANLQIISLRDIYLSAFLKAKGFPLHDAILDHQGRTVFLFKETEEISLLLKEYYAGTALVSPSLFIEAFKTLRSLTYALKPKKAYMEE